MAIKVFSRISHHLQQLSFLFWTSLLTYLNGPYYACLEFNRTYSIIGKPRKLTPEDPDLPQSLIGKVAVITGGSRGIGLEVVKTLLKKGCHVITGSSGSEDSISKRHREIMEQMGDDNKGVLQIWPLNLKSMESVKSFAEKIKMSYEKINYLICNGGVMFVPFSLTEDEFETHLAINYLSHCLLMWNLMPELLKAAKDGDGRKSRIVSVSSGAHRTGKIRFNDLQSTQLFSVYHAYAQSKLAQIMFTYKMHEKLTESGHSDHISVSVLHPGVCRTDLMNGFNFFHIKPIQMLPIFRNASEGAETIVYATLSSEMESLSGVYLEDCRVVKSGDRSLNKDSRDKLWDVTCQLLRKWIHNDGSLM